MKKPVYSLVKGDVFIADDGQAWIVDEIIKPEGYNCLPQLGEKPKAFTILAHRGMSNRRFYHQGTKIVSIKDQ